MKNNLILTGILTLFVTVFMHSCTTILEGLASSNIVGEWRAILIQDDVSGSSVVVKPSTANRILGNKIADGIVFSSDNTFSVFRQATGPTGVNSGSYDIDVLTLKVTFNGENSIKRILKSIGENEMIMRDTISGVAKTITYTKG